MLLLEFSMYPTDKGASVSDDVKGSLEIIDDSGLPYRLGPMGTTLEGEWDEVMAVVRACHERMSGCSGRIATQIKIDWRDAPGGRLDAKVETLRRKTGRDLKA
jgi:uncharacterized protein (TIGR00106 family)